MTFSVANIKELQSHLSNNPYFAQGGLPGAADAQIYFDIKQTPNVNENPNLYYWYLFINSFSNDLMKKWIQKANKSTKKEETKKQQPKKEEGDDLFDDAPPTQKKPQQPKVVAKKPKKEVIAKSIVIFDVKVYQTQTNLDQLAKKVLGLQIDGLVWNNEPKKLPVAYDIYKLQLGCVIEDEKVLTEDIFQKIQSWEEVQSVDMISMQKV